MKVYADKFQAQLSGKLAPVYVIAGDEPLLTGELADALRTAAREQGFAERESHTVSNANSFKWADCFSGLDNLSLFASRKLFELRLPNGKPGREGGAALAALAAAPPPDTLFVIHLPQLDKRSKSAKWAVALERAGVWVDVYAPEPRDMPRWLAQRGAAAGLNFERDALAALAARTEGNLLAARQEIDRLALLMPGERITAEHITGSVGDGARFDVYQLTDAALAQNLPRALRILSGLRREGTADALVSWALAREIMTLTAVWADTRQGMQAREAFGKHRIWPKRQPGFQAALRAHNAASIRGLTQLAARADRIVKGAGGDSAPRTLIELVSLLANPAGAAVRG